MRLRTFESFWLLQNGLLCSYPLLQQNISGAIVVIGGGITGALISDALVHEGYDVILIDKRDIAQGSTSATTSMLQYEIDTSLCDLAEMIGEAEAAACYKAGIEAVLDLKKLIAKRGVECDFEIKKSLYLAHNKKAAIKLKKEFEIRKKYKLGVEWMEPGDIEKEYNIRSEGGILSDTAASVDAYKLAHELIKLNVKKGMRVFDQTTIDTFEFREKGVNIKTEKGFTVSCEQVVFCSGFETTELLQEKIADLFHTFACVSEREIVLNSKLHETLIWNTDEPYLYARTTRDGRLLVGGEDSRTSFSFSLQKKKERKADKLISSIRALMPGINFIEDFSWSGIFGSTKDGLPYIGRSPEYNNALFVLGFGGNGITFSVQGRKIIVDLLAGEKNELAHYYRFGR